ncbi:NAD+ diphosphatase [Mesorhizobium sp. J18]|uniref:NAD(+) diphosphatase n=1 Tax=Mesorhizobium sp. J18 TaxID=935263 RepID=UPI001199FD12|nr:NAD(+) diphosphatase [Mesorhizobium sp. J18]TWG90834.1 NAD+ diphosphatase [Mesorhizobium sp. J18]
MTFPFFDRPLREPSQFVGFAGNRIDRQSENRSDDAAEKALADPAVRLLLLRGGRLYIKFQDGVFDPYFDVAEASRLRAPFDQAVLLGHSEKGPVVALPAGMEPEDLPETIKAIDYRSVYMQGLILPESLGELAQAGALLAWHANHRFCGRCGARTESRAGGYKRACTECNAEHFPRTDPVAIMLALRGDRCLLGRSPHFAPGMLSCLAGFIEPGETIENAVRRETFEESGIVIGRVAYHASQPWPFPYSLMIGCYGEAMSEKIRADTTELEDCRWVSRKEVQAAIRGDASAAFTIPPPGAIASHLIRAWAEAGV